MSLEGSHWIWGYLYDSDGNVVADAAVVVTSYTNPQGTQVASTDATGYYQLNIQDISNEGDLLVISFTSGTDQIDEFVVLDLDDLTHEVSATFQNHFQFTTSSFSMYLPLPKISGAERNITKNITLFNFWSNNIAVDDTGIDTEPLVLSGYLVVDVYTRDTIAGKIEALNELANNNEEVIISGINDRIDGVYIINSISFNNMRGTTHGFTWSISLEFVRD